MAKKDPADATGSAPETVPSDNARRELEVWFVSHVHNSAISRDTDVFNQAHAAKEALKALLARLDV